MEGWLQGKLLILHFVNRTVYEIVLWTPHIFWITFSNSNFQSFSDFCLLFSSWPYSGPKPFWNGQHSIILGKTCPIRSRKWHYRYLDSCEVVARPLKLDNLKPSFSFSSFSTSSKMGWKTDLAEWERGIINAFHSSGKSICFIARSISTSPGAVARLFRNPDTYRKRNHIRKNRKLSPQDKRNIIIKGRKSSSLAKYIKKDFRLAISTRRVQKILSAEPFLKSKYPYQKPRLLPRYKQVRLEWVRKRHRGIRRSGAE